MIIFIWNYSIFQTGPRCTNIMLKGAVLACEFFKCMVWFEKTHKKKSVQKQTTTTTVYTIAKKNENFVADPKNRSFVGQQILTLLLLLTTWKGERRTVELRIEKLCYLFDGRRSLLSIDALQKHFLECIASISSSVLILTYQILNKSIPSR